MLLGISPEKLVLDDELEELDSRESESESEQAVIKVEIIIMNADDVKFLCVVYFLYLIKLFK